MTHTKGLMLSKVSFLKNIVPISFSLEPFAHVAESDVGDDIPTAIKLPTIPQSVVDDGEIIKMERNHLLTTLKRKSKDILLPYVCELHTQKSHNLC